MTINGGYIDVKNENALIALAYIKETDNPLAVFCNYVLICLIITPTSSFRHDELSDKISEQFGLKMPQHMLKMCCRILEKDKKIERLSNGAGYLLKDFSFDLSGFEAKKTQLQDKERLLVNGLMSYAEDYKLNWNYQQAREYLTNFLLMRGNAVAIFAEKTVKEVEKEKFVSNEWYVGKYISHLLECNDARTEYLIDIVNGMMIYIGLYETNDYNQDRNQKFKGTNFYFDTKLILRLMGFSWTLEIESTKELTDLIEKEYGGNICVFEHTVGEIESALYNAAETIKRGEVIADYELRMYVELNKCTDYDLRLQSQSARATIERKLGFRVQPSIDWEEKKNYKNNLDSEALIQFVKCKHLRWKERAIENDIDSINSINILRKGDYSVKYGGRKKLPVFITTNTALVWDIKEYIHRFGAEDKGVAMWNPNALPIISDNMLMCRLWLPKAQNSTTIPLLTLARNAYAAQQANTAFFEKLRTSAKELKQKHNIDVIDISIARKEKLEELLVKNTAGDMEEISVEMLATSVEEMVMLETMSLQKSIEQLETEKDIQVIINESNRKNIIRSAVKRYKNKLGIKRVLIYVARSYWICLAIVFGFLSLGLSKAKGLQVTSELPYFGFIYVFIFLLLKVLEKATNKGFVGEFFLSTAIKYVLKKYSEEVKIGLFDFEKGDEKEILQACIDETPILNKYRKYYDVN